MMDYWILMSLLDGILVSTTCFVEHWFTDYDATSEYGNTYEMKVSPVSHLY